jgi:cytochrome c biogenesis protein
MTATKDRRGNMKSTKKTGATETLYDLLVSVRFSMFLLALVAIGSIFGTFIKQGASEDEYLRFYSEATYRIIKFFGLDNAYHSPWFYSLIVLFAINLSLCTIRRIIRFSREKHESEMPGIDRLLKMQFSMLAGPEKKEEAVDMLKKRYRVVCEEATGLIVEKGTLSRLGVFIIHGSIITVLIGSLIGLVFGFRGFVILRVGEEKDHLTTRSASPQEKKLGFTIKCKDFKVSHYPGGQPKDYVSAIELIERGAVVREKNIRVNDPLYYKGMRFYQSSYGKTNSFVFRVGDEEVLLGEGEQFKKGELFLEVVRFAEEIHSFGPGVQIAYLDGVELKTTWFLIKENRFRSQAIQGVNVRLEEIRGEPYTGLEVSGDPGVFVVWAGFALMLFGLYVNFFAYYRRVYAVSTADGIIISGYSLKNKEAFGKEFEGLKKEIYGSAP